MSLDEVTRAFRAAVVDHVDTPDFRSNTVYDAKNVRAHLIAWYDDGYLGNRALHIHSESRLAVGFVMHGGVHTRGKFRAVMTLRRIF